MALDLIPEEVLRPISLMDIPSRVGYVLRFLLGFVVLVVVSTLDYLYDQRHLVIRGLGIVGNAVKVVTRSIWWVLWIIGYVLKTAILIIFNPLLIALKIIDYNTKQFINLILGVFFNTKIEHIITIEYGVENFKMAVKWIQFFNVLCLTGLIIGLLTYYYVIKFIYKWTEYEKSQKKKKKIRRLKKKIIKEELNFDQINEATENDKVKESLIKEFLKQEKISNDGLNFNEETVEEDEDEDEGVPIKDSDELEALESLLANESLNKLPSEGEEDDITNYQTLNSLSISSSTSSSSFAANAFQSTPTKSSKTNLTDSNFSPVTKAFRKRLLESSKAEPNEEEDFDVSLIPLSTMNTLNINNEENYNTVSDSITSSIFTTNRAPMTPITTIEEDEDEDDHEESDKFP